LTLVETLAASAAVAIDNAHLIEALRQQTVELEARNEDLDAFAQTVAHDLKSPLALIASTAQVLELDFPDLSEEKLRHHLGVMAQRGRKASSLIEELLLLAELRHADIHIETLVMAPILTEAQKRLADMFTDQQPLIEMPTTWPAALGYGPWIEEVWVNYLSNALKYGGQPPQLELGAAKQRDGMVRFWVRDNGSGLTRQEQDQLFRPFTRFSQIRATGHGLGLSIVRRIIEKLGGEVAVESDGIEGQGSTFSFTLPAPAPQKNGQLSS
jgi:signal transduction histidine kinase